ncbi:648_t:CDS:2 [Scutellospora calospora]|uniref:648_t:CDS:1 n=1 Tax=Scutellospora calospora TaxID=85575 RepID=A0ACA9K920_9GLOM|nr:648_t:CDS:2 [Scutellospora calospora]
MSSLKIPCSIQKTLSLLKRQIQNEGIEGTFTISEKEICYSNESKKG